jgi:hypothetical protein
MCSQGFALGKVVSARAGLKRTASQRLDVRKPTQRQRVIDTADRAQEPHPVHLPARPSARNRGWGTHGAVSSNSTSAAGLAIRAGEPGDTSKAKAKAEEGDFSHSDPFICGEP